MNNSSEIKSGILWIISIVVISLIFNIGIFALQIDIYNTLEDQEIKATIKLEQPEFLLIEKPNSEALLQALDYYDIQYPEIVYAQAILETGHFKSRVCKEYNNLFGLYNSESKDYFKFEHWSDSIRAYIDCIQYRYNPSEDYYHFLDNIGYAEDPEYTNKLRKIVNNLNLNNYGKVEAYN